MHSRGKSWALGRFVLIASLLLPLASHLVTSATQAASAPTPPETPRADSSAQRAPVPASTTIHSSHTIYLKSGHFTPPAADRPALPRPATSAIGRVHVLLQLDFIPRQAAKTAFAAMDVRLLKYVPDYAWIASVPAADPAAVLDLPGVVWAGGLTVEDKIDPAILAARWRPMGSKIVQKQAKNGHEPLCYRSPR